MVKVSLNDNFAQSAQISFNQKIVLHIHVDFLHEKIVLCFLLCFAGFPLASLTCTQPSQGAHSPLSSLFDR